MARDDWDTAEWRLVIDVYDRHESSPPRAEVRRVSDALRVRGLGSEDPALRYAARRPSFRSVGSVWQHFYLVRRLARQVIREPAPQRLAIAWDEYRATPERMSALIAEEAARHVPRQEIGILTAMLLDVHDILASVIREFEVEPARRFEDVVAAQRDAWQDLVSESVLHQILDGLIDDDVQSLLGPAGLTGSQLNFKFQGFRRARDAWRDMKSKLDRRQALKWANIVLDSLLTVAPIPGLESYKEFKDSTEQLLEEAEPHFGWTALAPAY